MDTERSPHQEHQDPLEAAELLLEIVPRLMRLITNEAQSICAPGAITMTQLRALGLLVRGDRLPSVLARRLEITPATASEVVDLLVRRGLVERGGQPEDRRLTPLHITPASSTTWTAARARAIAALSSKLASLHSRELASLEVGLGALAGLLRDRATSGGEQ